LNVDDLSKDISNIIISIILENDFFQDNIKNEIINTVNKGQKLKSFKIERELKEYTKNYNMVLTKISNECLILTWDHKTNIIPLINEKKEKFNFLEVLNKKIKVV
jgi:hypothetical protein